MCVHLKTIPPARFKVHITNGSKTKYMNENSRTVRKSVEGKQTSKGDLAAITLQLLSINTDPAPGGLEKADVARFTHK